MWYHSDISLVRAVRWIAC
jgi:hypothetical protein